MQSFQIGNATSVDISTRFVHQKCNQRCTIYLFDTHELGWPKCWHLALNFLLKTDSCLFVNTFGTCYCFNKPVEIQNLAFQYLGSSAEAKVTLAQASCGCETLLLAHIKTFKTAFVKSLKNLLQLAQGTNLGCSKMSEFELCQRKSLSSQKSWQFRFSDEIDFQGVAMLDQFGEVEENLEKCL